MTDKEAMEQLQHDLQQLQQQVQEQYQTIKELQQRLATINHATITTSTPLQPRAPAANKSLENFIGLRLIHLVGIIVLVIGLSIGVKYAFDKQLISEISRIILAYGAGLILFLLSVRLKKTYALFSGILFSGAMASLYFTTYGAFVYYNMLSFGTAFFIMAALTVATIIKAISYDSKEVAALGLVGAYGIPFLISRNADKVDLFFLYILLINSGVLYLSFIKGWKAVGRLAQLITSLLFLGWASARYTVTEEVTGVLFLSLFYLQFSLLVFSPVFFRKGSLSQDDALQQMINTIYLYIAALLLLAPFGLPKNQAIVTGVTGLFVLAQTFIYALLLPKEDQLRKWHFLLAFVLLALFVALMWNGLIVTLLWLLMAVVVFSWGAWQKLEWLRLAGISLMGLTLLKLLVLDSARFTTVQKLVSYLVLGILLLVVSFFYQKFRQKLFDGNE